MAQEADPLCNTEVHSWRNSRWRESRWTDTGTPAVSLAAPSAAPGFGRIFSGTIFAHLVLQVKLYIPLYALWLDKALSYEVLKSAGFLGTMHA